MKGSEEVSSISVIDFLLEGHPEAEIQAFCRERLALLLQYDADNHSNYTDTLRVYLRSGNSLIRSSQQLFIHRNTMVQRMKKIEALLGVSFNDQAVRNDFYDIFRILDRIGDRKEDS